MKRAHMLALFVALGRAIALRAPTASRRVLLVALLVGFSAELIAEPLRLRADALASTASPAGLLVLDAGGSVRESLDAEAVVWMAATRELSDATGDVLVAVVRARSDNNRVRGQIGRFVAALGAVPPTHVDGGLLQLRLPRRFDVELVAGIPVAPTHDARDGFANRTFAARTWDWYAAARASSRIGDWGAVGIAFAERRDAGEVGSREISADAGFTVGRRSDVGARFTFDLANPGLAELSLTASHRRGALRADAYTGYRAASHLLPATSLFSVLGDVAAQRGGVLITWRAAPRLDVTADAGVRYVDELGAELAARTRLRLDDRGTSVVSAELRRSGIGHDAWTGLRGAARIALPAQLILATELELVVRDDASTTAIGRGTVWPWGLVAVQAQHGSWQGAIAAEASSTLEYSRRFDVIAHVSRRWGSER